VLVVADLGAQDRVMDKATAIAHLERQKVQILALLQLRRGSPEFKKWHRDTEVTIRNVFGERHVAEFNKVGFSLSMFTNGTPERAFQEAYERGLGSAEATLASLIDEVERYWSDQVAPTDQTPMRNALQDVETLCTRFPLLVRQLRKRHDQRPAFEVEDEYDVQDLMRALLTLWFDDVRAEEWTPSYGGKSARMDFLLKADQIVIETKKTRKGLTDKEVGDELMVDTQRYASHPDCKTLVCFIYDPDGRISNPRGLETDLSGRKGEIEVRVLITPKGT
jgi:hypothetical protein